MPVSGRYLIDTNIVIAFLNNEPSINVRFAIAEEIFVPTTVLGELYFGAAKSAKPVQNSKRVDRIAAEWTVVATDIETAQVYGRVCHQLRAQGRPIPENDLWIAAWYP